MFGSTGLVDYLIKSPNTVTYNAIYMIGGVNEKGFLKDRFISRTLKFNVQYSSDLCCISII